jgi:hypothetical protein
MGMNKLQKKNGGLRNQQSEGLQVGAVRWTGRRNDEVMKERAQNEDDSEEIDPCEVRTCLQKEKSRIKSSTVGVIDASGQPKPEGLQVKAVRLTERRNDEVKKERVQNEDDNEETDPREVGIRLQKEK